MRGYSVEFQKTNDHNYPVRAIVRSTATGRFRRFTARKPSKRLWRFNPIETIYLSIYDFPNGTWYIVPDMKSAGYDLGKWLETQWRQQQITGEV